MVFPTQLSPVNERIFTSSLGSLLFLKTCGFVQDHHARILDVTESSLRVRIGGTWLERFLYTGLSHKPIEVELTISREPVNTLTDEEKMRLPGIACSLIDVVITPSSRGWQRSEFEQFSRKLLWVLRQHFVSP